MNERGPSPIEESGHATYVQSQSTWAVSILRMKGAFACVANRSSDAAPLWAINKHHTDAILCSFLISTSVKRKGLFKLSVNVNTVLSALSALGSIVDV